MGEQGLTGPSGPAGARGLPGAQGTTGPQGPVGEPAADFTALANVRSAVVLIEAGSSQGSGVVISTTEFITAEHVIRGSSGASVAVPGVGLVFATVIGWDRTRDIALLTFNPGQFTPTTALLANGFGVVVNGKFIVPGELFSPVMAIGFVPSISTTTPIATFGHVGVRWNVIPGNISTIQHDAAVTSGMSGGALFDASGYLAGMIVSQGVFAGNNRALHWDEINEALPELRAGATNP